MQSPHDQPILVTGAAGDIGAIGRHLTAKLRQKGHPVRALVRREDARAEDLRRLGAEVVQGDLTDLAAMHRAMEGVRRVCFGMSVGRKSSWGSACPRTWSTTWPPWPNCTGKAGTTA